jgi:hypothetical protein
MRIELVRQERKSGKTFPLAMDVIYEDDFLAVIDKPAGFDVSGNAFRTIRNALPHNLKVSTEKDPVIKYNIAGVFDVKLEIKLSDTTLTVIKSDYIHVIDDIVVYPNPSRNFVYLNMMGNEVSEAEIFIFNSMGQEVRYYEIKEKVSDIISLGSFATIPSGVYFISVRTPDFTQHLKLTLSK